MLTKLNVCLYVYLKYDADVINGYSFHILTQGMLTDLGLHDMASLFLVFWLFLTF